MTVKINRSYPTFIITQEPRQTPRKKGPFYSDAMVEEFLREAYRLYPELICIVVTDPLDNGWYPEHGYEWLDINGDRRRRHPRKDRPTPTVTVKALAWEAREDGSHCGTSAIGQYHVFPGTGFSYDLCGPVGGRLSTHKRLSGAKAAAQADYEARIRSALSTRVQDVAGLERLRDVTFAVQHNPNCPAKYLVRLVGKSGRIDLKPYGNHFPSVKHETSDVLGFGETIDEAIDNALAAATPAKQERGE